MSSHELPVDLTADDRARVESELAELCESADGSGSLSLFLPDARRLIIVVAHEGEIISWCLMPAMNQRRAQELTVSMARVLRRELESVCRDVKALADATIGRASRIA